MNVARFIAFCGKFEYGRSGCIFVYISMTTRARDFKFAGTPVQRLQLAMVALAQKSFSAQYAWFSRGGSHIIFPKLNACQSFPLYIMSRMFFYHSQSTLRPPEVHTRYVHFKVNARFVLRLWGLMICVPRTWWQK